MQEVEPKHYSFYHGNNAYARPDTLGVFIDADDLKRFVDQKKEQLETLGRSKNTTSIEIEAFEYLLPFEQVLAHESFHIYQFLSCSIISNFASALRRKSRVKAKVIFELVSKGLPLIKNSQILGQKFEDSDIQDYINRVVADADALQQKMDVKNGPDDLSLREIIEACAVSFQHISQNDYLGEKIPLGDPTYTIAWDRFAAMVNLDEQNAEMMLIARLVFLFTGDVYLKFVHSDFHDTKDFEEALDLTRHLVDAFPQYIEEFGGDPKKRDDLFLEAISHVESDQSKVDEILNFCGTLSEHDQLKLYANIRLYVDVYKRVAIVGATTRSRPNNNKNRAVNRRLKSLFPHWLSDLSIPCILSSFEESVKFSTIWMSIHDVTFMDEIEHLELSLEEDNSLLDFMHRFTQFVEQPTYGTKCCQEHGHQTHTPTIKNCEAPDSLNQFCVTNFGKKLGEIVKHA